MSEYQYYEFRAIDAPLNPAARQYVSSLSSRTEVTAYGASFVYNYSDLPTDAGKLLAKYFDAMLYMTNWGSFRLLFRFPQAAIDMAQLTPYGYDYFVEIWLHKDYLVLDMSHNEYDWIGWVEGEGWLDQLIPLREDILAGDLRAPFLAWLHGTSYQFEYLEDQGQADMLSPPIPPNLKKLSPALETFCEFFGIDSDLIAAAAEHSPVAQPAPINIEQGIQTLPADEKDAFLIRLAQGEGGLSAQLKQRLRQVTGAKPETPGTRVPLSQIVARCQAIKQAHAEKKRREVEAARQYKLDQLAAGLDAAWREIFDLISQKQTRYYKEAAALLADLRELAQRDGWAGEFQVKIDGIYERYSRYPALHRSLKAEGLMPSAAQADD